MQYLLIDLYNVILGANGLSWTNAARRGTTTRASTTSGIILVALFQVIIVNAFFLLRVTEIKFAKAIAKC